MNKVIGIAGNVAAALGVLACLVSGIARLLSRFYVANVQITVIFTLAVAVRPSLSVTLRTA